MLRISVSIMFILISPISHINQIHIYRRVRFSVGIGIKLVCSFNQSPWLIFKSRIRELYFSYTKLFFTEKNVA